MQDCLEEFEKSQNLRSQHRSKLTGIFDRVSENLDEDLANEVNFDEVEELCKMIDEKDETLYGELMRLQDQLNQRRIKAQGFHPDSSTCSSIMINEIETVETDILKKENDDLERRIAIDQAEV